MSRRRNKYYDRKLKLQAVQDYFGGGIKRSDHFWKITAVKDLTADMKSEKS